MSTLPGESLPLFRRLDYPWRCLHDEQRRVVVFLHPRGTFAEVADEWAGMEDSEAGALADALNRVTAPGHHVVTMRVDYSTTPPTYTATANPVTTPG